jgi:endonuclease YncB( thermonuclease family)
MNLAPAQVLLVVALFLAGNAGATDLRVVGVSDGDTFTGLDAENRQVKVRLHGIDAPEAKQAFGTVARKALADLIADKTVSVEEVDRDRYGRTVGRVMIAGKLVNAEMVRAGLAWRYTTYDRRNEFGGLEDDARRQRRGLWADAAPVAPWEWRKTEKERKAAERAKSTRQSENRVTF